MAETGEAALLDLELRYEFPMSVRADIGANNLFDEVPNETPGNINSPTGSIGFLGCLPFGFNGRLLYSRLSVDDKPLT